MPKHINQATLKKKKYDSVVFDVDSTLTTIEGLDFLAKLKGKESEISKITKAVMEGRASMRETMETKMNTIAPSFNDLVKMGEQYIKNITPGAKETIKILKDNLVDVWILTGNFQPAVGMLADFLDINPENVITNQIFFNKDKSYLNFDLDNPLSNNGGKLTMIKRYKSKMKRTVLVGDGSTDLEAKDVVDLFIGFGGVVLRPNVKARSDIYISETNLLAIVPNILDNQ